MVEVEMNVLSCVQSDGQTHFSFEDLLIFITGADHLPALGLPKQISLRFYTQVGISHVYSFLQARSK